jgi:hypothetical protein
VCKKNGKGDAGDAKVVKNPFIIGAFDYLLFWMCSDIQGNKG